MIENISFSLEGFADYVHWQTEDKKKLKRINQLIKDIIRNGNVGIGKPEPLRGNLSGKWSREIDDKNRLIYQLLDDGRIEIYHCRTHYGDK